MDWFGTDLWLTWIALGVVLLLLELTSAELIFLMLGLAAFAASATARFTTAVEWQLVVFGVVAAALLSLVRPRIAAKVHAGPSLPSGDHGLVGRTAVVAEPVSHLDGRVQVGDVLWTARPVDPTAHFATGELVVITGIDGATALVERKSD